MLKYGNKEFRNLQEQVLANAQDIESIKQGSIALAQFGIFVVGSVTSADDLPDPATYLAGGGTYGDAFAVGTETPYYFYVFTRSFEEGDDPRWLNVGQFPQPGPQGETGATGATGATPNITATASANTLSPGSTATVSVSKSGPDAYPILSFSFGLPQGQQGIQGIQGIQGEQGIQGIQGIQGVKGDPGYLYSLRGQVASESALPDPEEVARDTGYLVGASAPYDVYIIIGEEGSLEWLNIGQIATVKPDSFVLSLTWQTSGTIDASMLAAINAETGPYYVQVHNTVFSVVEPGLYAALGWDSGSSTGEIGVLTLDLVTGAWTIDVAYIADSDHYVTTNTEQTISNVKRFTSNVEFKHPENNAVYKVQATSWGSIRVLDPQGGSILSCYKTGTAKRVGPGEDATVDLGGNTEQWKDLHMSGRANINSSSGLRISSRSDYNYRLGTAAGGASFSLFYGGTNNQDATGEKIRYFNNILSGAADNTISLGSSTTRWKDIFVSGNISDGTNSVTVADLAALITYAKTQGWIS